MSNKLGEFFKIFVDADYANQNYNEEASAKALSDIVMSMDEETLAELYLTVKDMSNMVGQVFLSRILTSKLESLLPKLDSKLSSSNKESANPLTEKEILEFSELLNQEKGFGGIGGF